MTKERELTREAFELLLQWLDPDRGKAGEKYEAVRRRLVTFFYGRGCLEADVLADKTITVVADKVPTLVDSYHGDPVYYFIGVARKVFQEHLRTKRRPPPPPPPPPAWTEQDYKCLERCLEKLPPRLRRMFEEYYRGRGADKQTLAAEFKISLNALRIRIHRIREPLRVCVKECVERGDE
jgi:DNA-directed RNA polymerase specialized sigma24 family protein